MGDLVGEAVEGTLYYIPLSEFECVRNEKKLTKFKRAKLIANMCRINALYMIALAGSGHIGSSFSSMEIFAWLLMEELDLSNPVNESVDIFFSSKGHDAPGYYAVQIAMGRLPFDYIHKLRRIDGLPGHPDIDTPGIFTNTGSLGMGVSKAKGMVLANRLSNREGRVFVLTGDGELQEGQFWESLVSAVNFGMHEITAIIDHNKLQSDTFLKNVSDLGDLETKLRAFGWRVERCDGNNIDSIAMAIASLEGDNRPKIIIADTVKGKGVSFMEHTSLDSDLDMYRFHSGAPDAASYKIAAHELIESLRRLAHTFEISEIKYDSVVRENKLLQSDKLQRLIPAYSKSLIDQAQRNPNLVVLDADLVLDTGLIPFREKYPERFIECGIAEQDMVSMAGGMALRGLLPIVHSFGCFLSTRPIEQIYNNATERKKIIYIGSLAGVIPGGPGHSHQAVRDIATFAGIPEMKIMEPSCESELAMLLDWSVNFYEYSSYIRLVSVPWEIGFELPPAYKLELGAGAVLIHGTDIAIIAYGPIMLTMAAEAAKLVSKSDGISVKVINLPWLNYVKRDWLCDQLKEVSGVITLDNHNLDCGQGVLIGNALAEQGMALKFEKLGNFGVPPSGSNEEVLERVGINSKAIAKKIINMTKQVKVIV